MSLVAVIGSRNSGKTTTVEILVRGLIERGYKVATVKHVPEAGFTIDTKGKDTWRHAQAGANTVASVAPNEIAVIKKVDTTKYDLKEIVKECQDEADIIILEGFSKLTARDLNVPKIVAVKTIDEVHKASNQFKPILAFVGPIPTGTVTLKIPHVDGLKEPQKLINILDKELANLVKREKKRQERLRIQVNGKPLKMKPFVQKIIRSSLLAMVSTLKNVDIEGNEKVSVTVERLPP